MYICIMRAKICIKCNECKDVDCFYVHKQMGDGRLNKCKDCCKSDAKKLIDSKRNDPDWVDKERARGREKYHRLGYSERKPTYDQKKKAIENWQNKFPEKLAAKLKMGKKIKPNIKGNNLHHWSYNEEHLLDVIELSVKDHNLIHRFLVYDQAFKMYRDLDTNLLDSRELHEKYINMIIKANT